MNKLFSKVAKDSEYLNLSEVARLKMICYMTNLIFHNLLVKDCEEEVTEQSACQDYDEDDL